MEKAHIISEICDALQNDRRDEAAGMARREYPFEPGAVVKRRYTEYQSLAVFMRDGFVDRFSGDLLVFPGTLRLLSKLLPDEFPAHRNWKMTESHLVYWELFPTIDHVYPVARGGADSEANWVTTSMMRNSAKSNWTLEELGWSLHPSGNLENWDGLTSWYLQYFDDHPEYQKDPYLKRWYRAAVRFAGSGENQ